MALLVTREVAKDIGLYQRGITRRVALRGTLTRFLPASASVISIFATLAVLPDLSRAPIVFGVIALEIGALTLGFGLALEAMRRKLFPAADVCGRRSVVAGLATPLALGIISVYTQGSDLAHIAGYSVLAGAAMGMAMYFPWMVPPTHQDLVLPTEEPSSLPDRLAGT